MAPTALASRFEQSVTPNALRSYLAEFISTFLYVFAAIGSTMSSRKLMPDSGSDPASLLVVAVANAFALASAVYISANISGGHVNPAVTFGMVVGGHISVPTALFYWASQMLASVLACLVLSITIAGQHIQSYAITEEISGFGASILEGILTFALVYTVCVASDRRHGSFATTGPLAIGLVAGANILAAGPFSGGSMNPACAFGSAIFARSFKNHAVYWVGPLMGAAVAGLLYDNVVFPAEAPDSVRRTSDDIGL